MSENTHSRRRVLRTAAAGVATTGLAGIAGADERVERIEINVGYENQTGRRAAVDAADGIKREFAFRALTVRAPRKEIDKLVNDSNVRYVEENGTMEALGQRLPWGQDRIDADVAHANGETGNGADIAILDTGIDSDHPDLQANVGTGKCFADDCCGEAGGIFCDTNSNDCHYAWDDDHDHGTHCAGIADAVDNSKGVVGVSTEATLHAGKVLNGCGSGSYSNIAAGIEWAADQGYDVASMSLGGDSSSTVKDACQYAYDNGVLLVAAAGNDGPCTDCVSYPAAYSTVVAVSATTRNDDLADYSSTGPEVELAAPGGASDGEDGTSVLSSIPAGYEYFNGTSMACPHVSGTGGQLMANGYTNVEARDKLQNTAEDVSLGSNEQGHGLVDTAAALGLDSSDNHGDCVDATRWPEGTGYDGYEHIDEMKLDGQFSEPSNENAYVDFTCPRKIEASQGGSFDVAMEWSDGGYDNHYANVYVDWGQDGDWSTATEYILMENVDDDSITAKTTVDVPSDAPTGETLVRVRLSWEQFYGPTATDEYGEVEDFTVSVQ